MPMPRCENCGAVLNTDGSCSRCELKDLQENTEYWAEVYKDDK
jgi:hypothetical protein